MIFNNLLTLQKQHCEISSGKSEGIFLLPITALTALLGNKENLIFGTRHSRREQWDEDGNEVPENYSWDQRSLKAGALVVMRDRWGGWRRTHWGWSPHHSLGNKPAVYGQLLICWIIIPFYPQLNQQQNNTLHKRRKEAGPHHSIEHSAERERQKEKSNVRGTILSSKE